jgi:hypothetical protein
MDSGDEISEEKAREGLQAWIDFQLRTMVQNWTNEAAIELQIPERELPMQVRVPATVKISVWLGRKTLATKTRS